MDGGGQEYRGGSDEGDRVDVFGDEGNDRDDGDDEDNRENRNDRNERDEGDDGYDGYDGYAGDEGDGAASAHSDGERREKERSRSQDVLFHGEKYAPPRRILFSRGKCCRTSDTTAEVRIKCDVKTATRCPCEDRACSKLFNIGTWGQLGSGSRVCVHCGFKWKGEWQGSGYGFMGKEDLVRHLNTSKCRARRGLTATKKTSKEILVEQLYYKINDPRYTFARKIGTVALRSTPSASSASAL